MFSNYSQTDYRNRGASSPGNTEPMTLGSPTASPTKSGQCYLPPYLFGDSAPSPVASPSWTTPKQAHPSTSYQSPLFTPSAREQHLYQSPAASSPLILSHPAKSGGPPINGLDYSTPTRPCNLDITIGQRSRLANESLNLSQAKTSVNDSYLLNESSFLSPAQIDPFYTQGESLKNAEQLDESWVTVFGFPSAASSFILQQFSQYGNIVEHKIPPKGNWMHLRYQSKLQAKKALSKDGKVFPSDMMVGVKPCIEMGLMTVSKEATLAPEGPAAVAENVLSEPVPKPVLKNIRPLTQAYQSPVLQAQVTDKSGGIVSKAFEFLWKLS